MYIGFDVSQTGAVKAGCGQFANAMIEALLQADGRDQFVLHPSFGDFYFDVNMPERNPYAAPNAHYGPRHATLEEAREFWTSADLESRLWRPHIVHANNYWCPTQLASARLVYTLYDLSFVENPAWTTEINRAACWEGVSRAALHADWIVAISEASREHYLRVFPDFPSERIRVIYPCARFAGGSRPGTRPQSLAGVPEGRFWLSVGTIEPRKNQRRIAEAFAQYLRAGGPTMPLVFAGGHGWLMADFQGHLARLGIEPHVVLTGYVSDDELAWLYRNCLANIYVSYFEGFGLPVLEGMQLGAPTIASNRTSMPEVAGDAALLIDPEDTDALCAAMLRIARSADERSNLAAKSRERAAQFDWKASAGSLLRLYQDALSAQKRAPLAGR